MRRPVLLLLFVSAYCLLPTAYCLEPAADPALAAVRIKSHGASATVIASGEGKSWLLGCAHMLTDVHGQPSEAARRKPLRLDGPVQPYAPNQRSPARLLAWDYDLDLSLIEIDNGPFHFVPVARPGHKPGLDLWSVGYDEMRWPVTRQRATLLFSRGQTTFTVEKPWHGRSGGGLIDASGRCLIGVVQGYEIGGHERGLYISHAAILQFLQRHGSGAPTAPLDSPLPVPRQRLLQPFCLPGL
jgi:hypothetical protein